MKRSIALALVALCACSYDDSIGRKLPHLGPGHLGVRWVTSIGGLEPDFAQRTLFDQQGNVIVTGHASGTVDLLAPPAMQPPQQTPPADSVVRAFVTRRAGDDGSLMWGASFDAGVQSSIHGVAADADGNVYACVSIVDAVGAVHGETIAGDGFVVKYDPTGHELRRRGFGAGSLADVWSVAVTDDGGVIVGGRYAGQVDVGEGLQTNTDVYTGTLTNYEYVVGDAFLIAFDADGSRRWGHTIAGPGGQAIEFLVTTPRGDVATLVRVASGSAVFGDTAFTAATDEWIYVLARYTAGGELIGARQIAPVHGTRMFARLATDRAGQLVVEGGESRDATTYVSVRIFDERGVEVRTNVREWPLRDLAGGFGENGMALTIQHAGVMGHDDIMTVFDEHATELGTFPFDALRSPFDPQAAPLELLGADVRDDHVALLGTFSWAVDFGTGPVWAHGSGTLASGESWLGTGDVVLTMFDWIAD